MEVEAFVFCQIVLVVLFFTSIGYFVFRRFGNPFRFILGIDIVVPNDFLYEVEEELFFKKHCPHETKQSHDCFSFYPAQFAYMDIQPGTKFRVQIFEVKKQYKASIADFQQYVEKRGGLLFGLKGMLLLKKIAPKNLFNLHLVFPEQIGSVLKNSLGVRIVPCLLFASSQTSKCQTIDSIMHIKLLEDEKYFVSFFPL